MPSCVTAKTSAKTSAKTEVPKQRWAKTDVLETVLDTRLTCNSSGVGNLHRNNNKNIKKIVNGLKSYKFNRYFKMRLKIVVLNNTKYVHCHYLLT